MELLVAMVELPRGKELAEAHDLGPVLASLPSTLLVLNRRFSLVKLLYSHLNCRQIQVCSIGQQL